MKELKWAKNYAINRWELKVNDDVSITLDKIYGVWSVWINDELKIGDNYDHIIDAKEKGLKVAKAILEY